MSNTEFIGTGNALPRIADAKVLDGRRVAVTWKNGDKQVIDVMPAFLSHRLFIQLRSDDALFQTLAVDEYGDALVWADGAELSAMWLADLAPMTLSNDEFRQAMDDLHMSLDGMALRLGVGRRLIAQYRKDKPIPPAIALATRHLVEHRKKAS